ncbi:hypothetical protein BB560_005586 [Smittium megazygosporum]|uniref:Uncharacterized protein n=1 Tax=Smittium megazygosporum TaxID=133381 RepID=A0A2T9Z300_9FUNG|nr:hypothetical protein BB560_006277 [Smittium megazygosporum]PVU98914.1 hypothetical protein BB560_005586 [Smittium megazygosporum]
MKVGQFSSPISLLRLLVLSTLIAFVVAGPGKWTIKTKPKSGKTSQKYDKSGGYGLFLIRGSISSSGCKNRVAVKQYGCVITAACVGKKKEFMQCPGGIYYEPGTVAVCQEVVESIGSYNLVNYTMRCTGPFQETASRYITKNNTAYSDLIKKTDAKIKAINK